MYAWREVASTTWYGPYADRELAELGRERIQRDAPWRRLRLIGCRYTNTARGIEFFELPKKARRAARGGEDR